MGWDLKQLRRHRFAIGGIAAYLLLFNLLVAALAEIAPAAADPLWTEALAHICSASSDGSQGKGQPAQHGKHGQECPLCGTACSMGGCAPVPAAVALAPLTVPLLVPAILSLAPHDDLFSARALYPSDRAAQAPPRQA